MYNWYKSLLNDESMELRIEKGGSIKDIQKEFNAAYPYLKIEFFKMPSHVQEKKLLDMEKIATAEPVSKSERFLKSGTVNMDSKRTAAQLEQDFLETFGFPIKLYRKSGSLWIETTLTENWSLEKQNEEGEFMSAPIARKNSFGADTVDEWREKE